MASILPNAKTVFVNQNGQPLANGSVAYYVLGTTTPKTTWQDPAELTPNPNPVPLDSSGSAFVWGSGVYRQVVKDSLGNTIWDGQTQDSSVIGAILGSFNGFADVRNQTTVFSAGATIYVAGRTVAGDGGGGIFTWNATSVAADDGGITLNETSNTGAGRWVRNFDGAYYPEWFGAVGNGIADDTYAIQGVVTAGGIGAVIQFTAGRTYLVSSTIRAQANQWLLGGGPNSTYINRTGDFGDTVYWSGGCGAPRVSGICFQQLPGIVAGVTALTVLPNKATSGAHINITNAIGPVIENCWFLRGVYGVRLNGTTIATIKNCSFSGVWDPTNVNMQEGMASIWLDSAAGGCAIVKIEGNYINGYKTGPRNITYTAIDGVQVVNEIDNIGPRFGILVYACEDLLVHGNFIGAQAYGGLYTMLQAGTSNLDWRITGNFFDDPPSGPGGANIYFNAASAGAFINGLTISGNVFNGELTGMHAIVEYNGAVSAAAVINNGVIVANTFQAYVGTPMLFYGATGVDIRANSITGYNARRVSVGGDITFCAGVILVGGASYCTVESNKFGGQYNNDLLGDSCYLMVSNTGNTPWLNSIKNNTAIGIGPALNQIGQVPLTPFMLTAAGNYQAQAFDELVMAFKTDHVAWTFGLPINPPTGRIIELIDANGQAGTYGVQVLGTVNGVVNPTYNTAYFHTKLCFNGTSWNVVGS